MSQFNYSDYQKAIERAQNGGSNAVKVGFFKLKDDGDEALVRINCSSLDDLEFASVHTINAGGKWMRVSCLNPLGAGHQCALCDAVAAGNTAISKASKKVYVQMLVSYRDKVTGQFTAPQPVVWERPAMFSRDIANKLRDFGDLRKVLLKITRNGKAGDMKTTYSLDYAIPTVFKPELVPEDFSAFTNFNIARHSYWEKTPEEINTFLTTGAFPEVATHTGAQSTEAPTYTIQANQSNPSIPVQQTILPMPTQPQPAIINPANPQTAAPQSAILNPANPQTAAPIPTAQPAVQAAPVQQAAEQQAARPVRDFHGFSF